MASSPDSAVRGAEDVEDDAHDQEDHAERVEDAHAEHDPEQQQDESQNDHRVPFVSAVCAQSWRGLAKGQGAMTDPDAAATLGGCFESCDPPARERVVIFAVRALRRAWGRRRRGTSRRVTSCLWGCTGERPAWPTSSPSRKK